MRTQQFIDFADQVTGRDAIPGARENTLVERLRFAIVAHLFSPPERDGSAGGLGLDLAASVARFRAELAFSGGLTAVNRELPIALGILGTDDQDKSEEAWTTAFVVSVHAIAGVVALHHYRCNLGSPDYEDEDEDEDEDGDGDGDGDADQASSWASLPGAPILDAIRPLADWLRRNRAFRSAPETREFAEEPVAKTGESAIKANEAKKAEAKKAADLGPRAKVLAKAMISAAILASDSHFRTKSIKTSGRDGDPLTLDCIMCAEPMTLRMIRIFAAVPHAFTLQPLSRPASYPGPRESVTRKAKADTTTSRYLVKWKVRTPFLEHFASACHTPDALTLMREAVNLQQAVGWRVNRRLMEWVRIMAWFDSSTKSAEIPEWMAAFSPSVLEALEATLEAGETWTPAEIQIGRLLTAHSAGSGDPEAPMVLARQYRKKLTEGSRDKRRSTRQPNPFANPLVTSVFSALGLDEPEAQAAEKNRFFLAWFADFRGRIYVDTPWFSPQGADVQRAMLEFAEGQPLTEEGRRNLKRHGGGLAKRSLVLKDLGIVGRNVVAFDERERWVDTHVDAIRASARNPLAHTFWFHASGDPFQFLAFCIEWDRQCSDPQAPCHLPVQIDGSCSGLQHMSALCGSLPLALAVNVIRRPDGLPADIYSELAEAVRDRLASQREFESAPAEPAPVLGDSKADVRTIAYDMLRERRHWITRDTAKKVIMTVPYGAGLFSQAGHVLDGLIDAQCPLSETDATAFEALGQLIVDSRKAKKTKAAGKAGSEPARTADTETLVWLGLRRVAQCITDELRLALDERYPAATRFKETVTRIGEAVLRNRGAGALAKTLPPRLPLAWPAPSGLAVCQPGFLTKPAHRSISLVGRKKPISVGFIEHLPEVDLVKQVNSLMPNLIHSLDATHLLRSIRDLAGRGIRSFGSIHDCIQCLPNDLPLIQGVIRDQFFKLYAPTPGDRKDVAGLPKVLADWYGWMDLLSRVAREPNAKYLRGELIGRRPAMGGRTVSEALLVELRSLGPSRRAMIDRLIGALADEPAPDAADLRPMRPFPALGDFAVDREGGLDLHSVYDSPYFFA